MCVYIFFYRVNVYRHDKTHNKKIRKKIEKNEKK